MKVDVLIASCCTPIDVQRRIVAVLEGIHRDAPGLEWELLDIEKNPELAVKYKSPMTPAIYVDGKLEMIGYPKQDVLEQKIRAHLLEV